MLRVDCFVKLWTIKNMREKITFDLFVEEKFCLSGRDAPLDDKLIR